MSLLPSTIMNIWTFANHANPQNVWSYDTDNSSSGNSGTYNSGNSVVTFSNSITHADSGSVSGDLMMAQMGMGTYTVNFDYHTITTDTQSAANTVDEPHTSSHSSLTTDVELAGTSTLSSGVMLTLFTITTTVTSHSDYDSTPSGSPSPANYASADLHYTLVQTGTMDGSGNVIGTYTLTANGSDSDGSTTTVSPTAGETDTTTVDNADSWTVSATGSLGTVDYGDWSITYDGTIGDAYYATAGFSTPSAAVNAGQTFTYNDTKSLTITASGEGDGYADTWDLHSEGSGTSHLYTVSGGTDPLSGVTLEMDDTEDSTVTYTFDDSEAGGSASQTSTGTQTVTGTVSAPGVPALTLTASDTGSGGWTAATGSALNIYGSTSGLFAGVMPFGNMAGMAKFPAGMVPYRSGTSPVDVYYNYMAWAWNNGYWYWPFEGDPPDAPVFVPQQFKTNIIIAGTTNNALLGRADVAGVATIPWNYTGVVLVPYTAGLGGVMVQVYWHGWQTDYWSTNDPVKVQWGIW